MGEFIFYLKQPPVVQLAEGFAKIVAEVSPNAGVTGFNIYTNSGDVIFWENVHPQQTSPIAQIIANPIFASRIEFLKNRPFLDAVRGGVNTNDDYSITIHSDKAFHLKLSTGGNRNHNTSLIFPIVDAIHRHFIIQRKTETFEAFLPEAEQSSLKTAQNILLDFSSQAARLSQLSADNTEKMSQIIIEKTDALDKRYEKKNTELDETHRSRTKELNDQKEIFTQEKAQFDARENTVVRRDLLSKIQSITQQQKEITITPATLSKRKPIIAICQFLLALALTFIIVFGVKIFSDASPNWSHVAPFSTGILLLISTSIYYIRWNDQWFKEHANAEFENRKFSRDIVRASWIAELLFEWKDKKEVPFPEQLVTSYTTGLFKDSETVKATKHPFDDLKSLAGSVSEIKFSDKGGISFRKKPESEKA